MELIVCFVVDYLSFTFKAFNLHLKYVEAVLQRLAKANLSLKLNKFKFGIFLVSRDFTEILSKNIQIKWHLSPLQILKQKLSVYPILHFVDFDGEFILDADAKLIRFAVSLMNIKAKYYP